MRTIQEDLILREPTSSPKHVVIVMDALKEFSMQPLLWTLENVQASSTVTLLGLMPWLNIPLSTKTWLDIWTLEVEDLSILRQKSEQKSDSSKFLRLQAIVDLCDKYGVVPQRKVVMGYPLRQVVVEQIMSLDATWVVFDRYHQKNKEFYASKIPCDMVMMNDNGNFDVTRGTPMNNN